MYDFSTVVLNDSWSPRKAVIKLNKIPELTICDALLDQQIFSGVGNIIKNEVLFRIKMHPKSLVGSLPPKLKSQMSRESRKYSLDFLKWKRKFTLKNTGWYIQKKSVPTIIPQFLKSTWVKPKDEHFSAIPASCFINNFQMSNFQTRKSGLYQIIPCFVLAGLLIINQ